jgi:hypothetical protein
MEEMLLKKELVALVPIEFQIFLYLNFLYNKGKQLLFL